MTKRDRIALALWYERQPQAQGAIWNTRHPKWPLWLQILFAGYISWKLMGGGASWYRKAVTFVAFWVTVRVMSFKL